MEKWKTIIGYENKYLISDGGNIKSIKRNMLLKPFSFGNGYLYIGLSKNGKNKKYSIHRLVALYFVKNPENKKTVNHKDGNRQNNNVRNLEWMTLSENMLHSFKYLGRKRQHRLLGKFGKLHPSSKCVLQFDMQNNVIKEWECTMQIQRKLGIDNRHISRCCLGGRKSAGGYKWRYK